MLMSFSNPATLSACGGLRPMDLCATLLGGLLFCRLPFVGYPLEVFTKLNKEKQGFNLFS
jgi:hypothetical protein